MDARLYTETDLPPNLADVFRRLAAGGVVYGFELHLLAEYVSQ